MRVKSHWFKTQSPKSPEEVAGAAAFIAWRIAVNALKQARQATFDIDIGTQYFNYLAEFLIFLLQASDRLLDTRYSWNIRGRFINAMANKMAEDWAENQVELMNGHFADLKAGFIQRLNERGDGYAEHPFAENEENFGFLRYFGHCLTQHMNANDQPWILDRTMTVEAPEALTTLTRALRNLLDKAALDLAASPITCPE